MPVQMVGIGGSETSDTQIDRKRHVVHWDVCPKRPQSAEAKTSPPLIDPATVKLQREQSRVSLELWRYNRAREGAS